MQLGGEKETTEHTRPGAIQPWRVSAGVVGLIVDGINVVNMPFLFRDTPHAEQMVALCWMNAGSRSLYNSMRPIKSIEDVKGMKFRVIGNPIFIEMVNALGGTGVAMGYDQVLGALQTGKIDGAENNRPSYVFSNHYTAAKCFSLTEHLIIPEMLVFSKRVWATLSADDQALIRKLAREAQREERALWIKYELESVAKAKATGCLFNDIQTRDPSRKPPIPCGKIWPEVPGHDQPYPGYRIVIRPRYLTRPRSRGPCAP
jgi:TRAP-type C4-dicarboxylate transport system substrate-binding protein